jgi:Ca2+-binding RTX toxin-like protein
MTVMISSYTATFTYVPNIYGTDGDDWLYGDQSGSPYGDADHIYGFGGNDHLFGGRGSDWLQGGLGNDTIDGGSGSYGGYSGGIDVADYGYATYGIHASLTFGNSYAMYSSVEDSDTLIGIEGLSGSYYNDVLEGNDGFNTLAGNHGDDALYGWGNGDSLDGGEGNDWLFAGDGNDVLVGGLGNDFMDGGADFDRVSYSYATQGMYVDLKLGSARTLSSPYTDLDSLSHIEGIDGSNFGDYLYGDDAANIIYGLDGSDYIRGLGGNDALYGQNGDDAILSGLGDDIASGGDGSDSIFGDAGNDALYGDAGNDFMHGGQDNDIVDGGEGDDWLDGGSGVDVVHGGAGSDTISLEYAKSSELIDIGAGYGYAPGVNVTFDGIENAYGGQYSDELIGSADANHISGADGADMIHGLDGNDFLEGGNGNDHLVGGIGDDLLSGDAGTDEVNGGAGFDIASYQSSQVAVTVDLQTLAVSGGDAVGDQLISIEGVLGSGYDDVLRGSNSALLGDHLDGNYGDDQLFGRDGNDFLDGNHGDDTVSGDAGNDTLWGGEDQDSLSGGDANDLLYGEQGNDALSGGNGNDMLAGGVGKDVLTGGANNDTFRFYSPGESGLTAATRDVILDFAKGLDRIDIQAIDANSTLYGNQGFTFIGQSGFTPSDAQHPHASAGQLRYFAGGSQTIIAGDTNGDAVADFQVALSGHINLSATDFLL